MNAIFYSILLVIFGQFLYEFFKYRELKNKMVELLESHEKWLNDSTLKRPNNAIFKTLYQEYSGQTIHPVRYYNKPFTETADLVASFPTRHEKVLPQSIAVLDNMNEYFIEEYQKRKSIKYLIELYIFAPRNLLTYLGLTTEHIFSKISVVVFWILAPAFTIFRGHIINWFTSFFPK